MHNVRCQMQWFLHTKPISHCFISRTLRRNGHQFCKELDASGYCLPPSPLCAPNSLFPFLSGDTHQTMHIILVLTTHSTTRLCAQGFSSMGQDARDVSPLGALRWMSDKWVQHHDVQSFEMDCVSVSFMQFHVVLSITWIVRKHVRGFACAFDRLRNVLSKTYIMPMFSSELMMKISVNIWNSLHVIYININTLLSPI